MAFLVCRGLQDPTGLWETQEIWGLRGSWEHKWELMLVCVYVCVYVCGCVSMCVYVWHTNQYASLLHDPLPKLHAWVWSGNVILSISVCEQVIRYFLYIYIYTCIHVCICMTYWNLKVSYCQEESDVSFEWSRIKSSPKIYLQNMTAIHTVYHNFVQSCKLRTDEDLLRLTLFRIYINSLNISYTVISAMNWEFVNWSFMVLLLCCCFLLCYGSVYVDEGCCCCCCCCCC